MDGWTRQTLQTIVTKLDLNACNFAYAKQAAENTLGRKLSAKTKKALVREMFQS